MKNFQTRRQMQVSVRSSGYEYKIKEISIGSLFDLSSLKNTALIQPAFDNDKSSEEIERITSLRQLMFSRLMILAKKHLTKQQFKIMKMYFFENKTQAEIAKILKVPQATVCCSINGNYVYREGGKPIIKPKGTNKKRYGGTIKKLLKITRNDEPLNLLFKELIELEDFYPPKNFICWKMLEKKQ